MPFSKDSKQESSMFSKNQRKPRAPPPLVPLFTVILCIGSFLYFRARKCRQKKNNSNAQNMSGLPAHIDASRRGIADSQVFTFREIKTATMNFHMQIGSGACSAVFLGRLSNNNWVAVKRCITWWESSEVEFKAELESLASARNENIVKLIGYCTENSRRILVMELMSKGSLLSHLHPENAVYASLLFSSWKMRVKVLVDVAKGICYLHQQSRPRIIHRDIKSACILIDESWVAKISDFALAVFGPNIGIEYLYLDEGQIGTGGYVDPEYIAHPSYVTQRNDVYSFGVVMLEVITGRKALDGAILLAEFASLIIHKGELVEVLDDRIRFPPDHELMAINRIAHLACQCVRVPSVNRPKISDVLLRLERALALFD